MRLNHTPAASKLNLTGCCPQFEPKPWDAQTFKFKDKPFVRFTTLSLFYIPINMGLVITRVMKSVERAGATSASEPLMLSYDLSPWASEHYLAVTKKIPGLDNTQLSGTFFAKVFEGPYQEAPKWIEKTKKILARQGKKAQKIFLNYTMCPKCAKYYGKNYVVAFARV